MIKCHLHVPTPVCTNYTELYWKYVAYILKHVTTTKVIFYTYTYIASTIQRLHDVLEHIQLYRMEPCLVQERRKHVDYL